MSRAIGLAIALALVLAAPAHAGILADEDATELAQSLAEAQQEQDICYGWSIGNNFDDTGDVGSSTGGPGSTPVTDTPQCMKGHVVLDGFIDYACNSCESEDSARVSINSNLPDPPTVKDLEALGLKAGELTGDKDDTTLVNMVNALPLLAADRGNAPYVDYEPAAEVPAADHATGTPGSDLLRDSWIWLVLCGALMLAGPGFYLYKRAQTPKPTAEPVQPPSPAS
ncbi:MAG: hypothetical protein WKF42_02575 [Solirubrobacteraceae bacterium]